MIAILAGIAAVALPSSAEAATQAFTTPGTSVYTVPTGISELSIAAVGAAGGPWCANGGGPWCANGGGGRGASTAGRFPVSPG